MSSREERAERESRFTATSRWGSKTYFTVDQSGRSERCKSTERRIGWKSKATFLGWDVQRTLPSSFDLRKRRQIIQSWESPQLAKIFGGCMVTPLAWTYLVNRRPCRSSSRTRRAGCLGCAARVCSQLVKMQTAFGGIKIIIYEGKGSCKTPTSSTEDRNSSHTPVIRHAHPEAGHIESQAVRTDTRSLQR
jgi:hypothetical protein